MEYRLQSAGRPDPCRLILLIRAPVLAVKWMLVALSVLVWVVVAPIVEIFREVVARLRGVREG